MSEQPSISKQVLSMKTERQIELLKKKIQELTTENQILREINVKLQIENFNLQKKLDSKQLEDELDYEVEKLEPEPEEPDKSENFYTMVYQNENDTELTDKEEYLDQEETVYEVQEEEILKDEGNSEELLEQKTEKRKYSKVIEEKELIDEKIQEKRSKHDISYQITILNNDENAEIFLEDDTEIIEAGEITPKDAIIQVYRLASKNSVLEKIKSMEKGKQKDSAFVSKVLDLLFDRVTLANSTAHGQKCQSKLHLPPRPPLDHIKMDLCLKAFMYRLRQDDVSEEEKQARLKLFNKLVNDKIQNCRKCLSRTDSSKLLET